MANSPRRICHNVRAIDSLHVSSSERAGLLSEEDDTMECTPVSTRADSTRTEADVYTGVYRSRRLVVQEKHSGVGPRLPFSDSESADVLFGCSVSVI